MEASNSSMINEAYWPLPYLYSSFTSIWIVFASCWIINTYINRHFQQVNSLQWTLALVPCVKSLQLAFSFLFWYVSSTRKNGPLKCNSPSLDKIKICYLIGIHGFR
ncbi:putative transmembrane protein GPR107/GPR108 [Helianthus annuus]|nr:putative transmembrane protein GPR107/GPR108 [Helianthus annuus]KAJ0544553.1 putative transmembrane protein GPR107/GPR108 [Helianthus annuus]